MRYKKKNRDLSDFRTTKNNSDLYSMNFNEFLLFFKIFFQNLFQYVTELD